MEPVPDQMIPFVETTNESGQFGEIFRCAQTGTVGPNVAVCHAERMKHGGNALIHQLFFLFPHGQFKINHALGPGLDHRFDVVRMDINEARENIIPLNIQRSDSGIPVLPLPFGTDFPNQVSFQHNGALGKHFVRQNHLPIVYDKNLFHGSSLAR